MASCCCWVLYRWWLVQPWCIDISWVWWVPTTTYATTAYYTEPCKCHTTQDQLVTPPKRRSTALHPTSPQLTPRRHRSTTPRRHRSTTPRRHRHVKPRFQFTTLQPTFLQSTTTVMFQSTTPPRQPNITPLLTLIFTTPKIRTHHSAPSYYTTKAAKYYTANYDSAISKTKFLNTRATIFWGYLYLSVIFVVIGHWELIIDLKWENKSFTTCNYFVRLLLVTTSLSTMKD
jgi:hypothetical protein